MGNEITEYIDTISKNNIYDLTNEIINEIIFEFPSTRRAGLSGPTFSQNNLFQIIIEEMENFNNGIYIAIRREDNN